MKAPKRIYTAPNGVQYPLYEAPYPIPVTVFRSDAKKAKVGDPTDCLIARGLRRLKGVEHAWVGCGKDAYVCFAATKLRKAYALHFTINAQSSRVRDYFDVHKDAETQNIQLDPPTPGNTLTSRSKANARRYQSIKNGTHVATTRASTPRQQRMVRLGVARRPKAMVKKNRVITPSNAPPMTATEHVQQGLQPNVPLGSQATVTL